MSWSAPPWEPGWASSTSGSCKSKEGKLYLEVKAYSMFSIGFVLIEMWFHQILIQMWFHHILIEMFCEFTICLRAINSCLIASDSLKCVDLTSSTSKRIFFGDIFWSSMGESFHVSHFDISLSLYSATLKFYPCFTWRRKIDELILISERIFPSLKEYKKIPTVHV